MRHRVVLSALLAACLLAGCPAKLPTAPVSPRPSPKKSAGALGDEALRKLPPAGSAAVVRTRLVGTVRLISDNGLGLISDNGLGIVSNASGTVIANNGGGLISDNGLGLISDNGLGLVADNGGYRLFLEPGAAAEPRVGGPQAASAAANLAEARVEVLDAEGRILADASGKPLTATSDAKGAYTLDADLPAEALVLRVRLFPNGGPVAGRAQGGELLAMVPKPPAAGGARRADLDTDATLGAAYVLETFVQKRQAVYDRLPGAEAGALRTAIAAAAKPATLGTYRRADLVAAADAVRRDVPAVAAAFGKIEAALLLGQAQLGAGLPAVEVPLGFPGSVVGDGEGGFWIGEMEGGRVRHVGADGRMSLVGYANPAGAGDFLAGVIGSLPAMLAAPDGGLLVVDPRGNQVRRLGLDGTLTNLIGTGRAAQEPGGQAPAATALSAPWAIARAPDGTLYVGEAPRPQQTSTGRILAFPPGGGPAAIVPAGDLADCVALACEADGTLWALDTNRGKVNGRLHRRPPGGAFAVVTGGLALTTSSRLQPARGGGVYMTESGAHTLWRVAADGTKTRVAGTGAPGVAADGTPAATAALTGPAGMWEAPDGALYVAQAGTGLVSRIAPGPGAIATVAGFAGGRVSADGTRIGISGPVGLAFDGAGRLLLAEASSHAINRLEGTRLVRVAGGGQGFAGDGGPGAAARFDTPGAIAIRGDTLYLTDGINQRIRKVDLADPAHRVETVAGSGEGGGMQLPSEPAASLRMRRPHGLAIDARGVPYWTDAESHQVQRLTPDGRVELVAGTTDWVSFSGDGEDGPAVGQALHRPTGLAFDAEGRLYVVDTGNFRIRRLTFGAAGATSETWAGQGFARTVERMLAGGAAPVDTRRQDAYLAVPGAICIGPDQSVYVAEFGSGGVSGLLRTANMDAEGLVRIGPRIRRFAPDGTITTIAGDGGRLLNGQDGQEPLGLVVGLAFDGEGRLLVADKSANQILVLPKEALR